jgi:multiple sugar transport system permease protein
MPTIGGRAAEASLAMPRKGHVGFAGVPVSFAGAAVLLAVYDHPTVASVAASGRRWQDTLEERRFLAPLLIAPAVLFIALLVGVPLVLAIYLSLTDATAGSLSGDFVGLRNYLDAWDDPTFRRALKNTIIFTVVSQAIVLVCAGFLAHALVRNFRGRWLLRFLILLPWAAPVALSTVGFLWIFHSLYSVVNWTLVHDIVPGGPAFYPYKAINWAFARDFWPGFIQISPIEPIDPPQWLGEPRLAMAAIILIHAWRIIPFATVIFIAGLASLPPEIDDAALVDGATGLRKFWYVTFPLQLPIALVALLFGIVFTATDITVVQVLTQGGPFNSTQILTTWAYATGINGAALGEGAAISLYLLPPLAFVAILMLWFARKVEVT